MPTVPRYVQTERPRGYQNVQPSRGGQMIANAWQQAGKALQGAGSTLNDMALDMQRRQDEAVAQEAMTAYEEKRHVFTAGVVENKKGKNALGDKDTPSVYDQSVKWHADTVASLLEDKTPAQKRLLEPYFAKRGQSMDEWAFTYYRKQWDTFETEQFNAGIKAMLMRAKDDPSQLESCMANIGQMGHNYNSARGLPPEKTELLVRSCWEDAGKAIVERFLNADDPNAADAFLDKYEKQLSAGTVKALRGKSKTKREAMAEKAEKLKEKAAKAKDAAAVEEETARVWDMVKDFDRKEKRSAEAVLLTEHLPEAQRTKVRAAIQANIDEDELVRQAHLTDDYLIVGVMLRDNPNDSPSQLVAKIQGSPLADEVKQKTVADIMATPAYKAELQQKDDELLARAKAAFDQGVTGKEYKAMVGKSGMSAKAVAEAMKYADNKGKYANVSQSDFARQYKASVGVELKGADLTRMYNLFGSEHPDGKPITKKELEDWTDGMALQGMDKTPLGTYVQEGRQAKFVLNEAYLTDSVKKSAQQFYASKGLVKASTSPTEQKRLMLMFNTLSMGIPVGKFLSLDDLAGASAADILNTAKTWNNED